MRTMFHCECCDVGYPSASLAESCEILHGKPSREQMHRALQRLQAEAANTLTHGGALSPAFVLDIANKGLGEC